jgi:hypothetical protein
MVVSFKSGIHRGPAEIVITPTSPSGTALPALTIPVNFEGDEDRGVSLVLPMAFPVQEPGVYWFNVSLDGQSFSEIPLRVIYHRVVPMVQQPNPANAGLPPER